MHNSKTNSKLFLWKDDGIYKETYDHEISKLVSRQRLLDLMKNSDHIRELTTKIKGSKTIAIQVQPINLA